MKDIRFVEFLRASGRLGSASVAFAAILFVISVGEYIRGDVVAAYALEGSSAIIFTFGVYLAWLRESRKLRAELARAYFINIFVA